MKRENSILTYLFIFTFIAHLTICCENDSNQGEDDAGTETDPDTNDGDSTDETDADAMDCDGPYLFSYGPKTITYFSTPEDGTEGDLEKMMHYTYEYDALKRPVTSVIEYFTDGVLFRTCDRTYIYDDNGELVRLDRVYHFNDGSDDILAYHEFTYDEAGRLLSEEFFSAPNGEMQLDYILRFDYGKSEMLSRQTLEYVSSGMLGWGFAYQYDTQGRLAKKIVLDPENEWVETDEIRLYEYDLSGRVSTVNIQSIDEMTGNPVVTEENFEYLDDGGRVLTSVVADGSQTTSYEWQGLNLTITIQNTDSYTSQEIYTFTEDGSSAYHDIFPVPPEDWPLTIYGNGFINGCAGR